MISEYEAPRYLWNLVRDLTADLRNREHAEALNRVKAAVRDLKQVVYDEHLTRAQIRGVERVAALLESGQIESALELLEGEIRNSFQVAPTPDAVQRAVAP